MGLSNFRRNQSCCFSNPHRFDRIDLQKTFRIKIPISQKWHLFITSTKVQAVSLTEAIPKYVNLVGWASCTKQWEVKVPEASERREKKYLSL